MPKIPDVPPALRLIGWPAAVPPEWEEALAARPQANVARIIEQHRSGYVAAIAPETSFKAESPPQWMRPRFPNHERAAVGDWVLLDDDKILSILPRRSSIKRGAAGEHYHQQVIAANIDTVFVVVGLDDDFNPRRIERYLLLVGGGGAQPVVVLTKADANAANTQAALDALKPLDAPVFAVNAKAADSVAALHPFLDEGQSVVLVGSSGAGKSTLTNTLLGSEKMKTGEVREHDSRGRHTTTHRALLALPSGACLIDTPGMRELKPTGEEELAEGGFADIEELAAQCRFRDCTHRSEPDCAVRAAIVRGELEEARLLNYFKLKDELLGAANKLAQRNAELKAEAAAKRKRAHAKR